MQIAKFDTLEDAKKSQRLSAFKQYIHYETNGVQDANAIAQAKSWLNTEYDVTDHNCGIFVWKAAVAGRILLPTHGTYRDPAKWWPEVVQSVTNPKQFGYKIPTPVKSMGLWPSGRPFEKEKEKVPGPISYDDWLKLPTGAKYDPKANPNGPKAPKK